MKKTSKQLFERAKNYIPGGVNSPVRAFGSVGLSPIFISKASGSKIYDAEGREYIDYVASWGPMILGHAHPAVVGAVTEAVKNGTSYGAPTESEVEMAELIVKAFPSIERVRMVNSGTEATMSAIRLARGYTKRAKIVKCEGCYHGHVDALLVKAGSGVATLGIPGSPGVPESLAELTITVPYNDIEAIRRVVDVYGDDIACLIIEPVAGNMGVVPPLPGYLEAVRTMTAEQGILLIFDEVITGFRVAYGGMQTLKSIDPDLTCLGKIIGGGLPVGAFGGKREIMNALAPIGPVYQAGTLSGNPLAMAAGVATLKVLQEQPGLYAAIENKATALCGAMERLIEEAGVPGRINRVGSMFTLFFTDREVTDFRSAQQADTNRFSRYFREMFSGGVNVAPSQFEASFLSVAHGDADTARTLETFASAVRGL